MKTREQITQELKDASQLYTAYGVKDKDDNFRDVVDIESAVDYIIANFQPTTEESNDVLTKTYINEWRYKGFIIIKFEHPKLAGKYEVFRNDKNETNVGRCCTLKEAKELCDNTCEDPQFDIAMDSV